MTILAIIIVLAAFFIVAGLVDRIIGIINDNHVKRAHNSLIDQYLDHHRVY
jgi:hypothetical protein